MFMFGEIGNSFNKRECRFDPLVKGVEIGYCSIIERRFEVIIYGKATL